LQMIGVVTKTYDNMAVVSITRHSGCGENCAMCKGGCTPTKQFVEVSNEMGAVEGNMVQIELSDRKVLLAAFFVYVFPIFTLIAGYLLFGWQGGVAAFALPFLLIKFLDKRLAKRYTATITKIMGGSL